MSRKPKIVHEEIEERQYKPPLPIVSKKSEKLNPLWTIIITIGLLILAFILITNRWAGRAQAKTEESKLNICHFNSGKNKYEGIEIPESAWETHQSHGDFLYYGPLDKNGKPENKDKAADIWCEENIPQPSPTPTPTDMPDRCEQESWSCSECHEMPPDNACYENFISYCDKEYACGWVENCDVISDAKLMVECPMVWRCEASCEVEPTPTPTPATCTGNCGSPPTFAGSSTEPPVCGETDPEPVVNPHVYRNGDTAIVKWWPVSGNQVHIYYKQVSAPDWQYSVTVPNNGYYEIHGLGSMDISFAVQAVNGCSGGASIMSKVIIDGNSNRWILFR